MEARTPEIWKNPEWWGGEQMDNFLLKIVDSNGERVTLEHIKIRHGKVRKISSYGITSDISELSKIWRVLTSKEREKYDKMIFAYEI